MKITSFSQPDPKDLLLLDKITKMPNKVYFKKEFMVTGKQGNGRSVPVELRAYDYPTSTTVFLWIYPLNIAVKSKVKGGNYDRLEKAFLEALKKAGFTHDFRPGKDRLIEHALSAIASFIGYEDLQIVETYLE